MTTEIISGCCLDHLPKMADNSIDAIVTDPPYEIGIVGTNWDNAGVAYAPGVWIECLRVLKPGGHLLAFGGTRTYHRLACAVEDAGFEIRDAVSWLYGCLDDQTKAITPDGAKEYASLSVGDMVMCYSNERDTYSYQPILDAYDYEITDTCYRITGRHGTQVVTGDHRVLVERDGKRVFVRAAALERYETIPVLENLHGVQQAISRNDQRTGNAENNLRESLCGQTDKQRKKGGQATCQTQADKLDLSRLWQSVLGSYLQLASHTGALLFSSMQRTSKRTGMGKARTQGTPGAVSGKLRDGAIENDRRGQSGVERWSCLRKAKREIRQLLNKVCAVSGRVCRHVPQGRLCHAAQTASSASVEPNLEAHGDRASHRPQSGKQSTGQSDAIPDKRGSQAIRMEGATVSGLVRVMPIQYTGKVWCLRVQTGCFVAERNGLVFPTGNSGFPKSHNISKALDKTGGDKGRQQADRIRQIIADAIEETGLSDSKLAKLCDCSSALVKWWRLKERDIQRPHADIIGNLLGRQLPVRPETVSETPRQKTGTDTVPLNMMGTVLGDMKDGKPRATIDKTEPLSDEGRQWQGWGTALKPGMELIVLARKPISEKTVALNVKRWRTGAINIDGCRIPYERETSPNIQRKKTPKGGNDNSVLKMGKGQTASMVDVTAGDHAGRWPANVEHDGSNEATDGMKDAKQHRKHPNQTGANLHGLGLKLDKDPKREGYKEAGRWPANVAHDGSDEVEAGMPVTQQENGAVFETKEWDNMPGGNTGKVKRTQTGKKTTASASRYFKQADFTETEQREQSGRWPANVTHDGSDEVEAGMPVGIRDIAPVKSILSDDELPDASLYGNKKRSTKAPGVKHIASASRYFYCAKASRTEREGGLDGVKDDQTKRANTHPTVKPIELMRWLCRLITPPNGIVLDPFAGSGTTIIAAHLEGFDGIGIEQSEQFAKIANARLKYWRGDLV